SEHSFGGLRCFSHLVLKFPGGIVRLAKKTGFLQAQFSHLLYSTARIILITFFGSAPTSFKEFFSCCTIAHILQGRLLRGILQRQHIFTFISGGLCIAFCGGYCLITKPIQLAQVIKYYRCSFGSGKQTVRKLSIQRCLFFI